MDKTKFDKIEGREALRRLLDGENIYVDENTFVHLPIYNDLQRVDIVNGKPMSEDDWISITEFVEHEWFIKKPFDVRSALVNNPNKWVAVYLGQECPHWFKVGFDLQAMSVVKTHYSFDVEIDDKSGKVNYLDDIELEEILDLCIDIEDVPQSEKDMLEQPWKTERITYISPKLREYFNKRYPHLTENDIEAILLSVKRKLEDEPYLPAGSKPCLVTNPPYTYEIEEIIASLYEVNPAIPHLYDDEGVLFKKEKIKKG